MKHKIVLAACLVLVVVLAVVCVKSYDHKQYFINLGKTAQHRLEARQAAIKSAEAQDQQNKLEATCQADHAAYIALTPAQRLKAGAIDCDPSLQLVQ